MQNLIVGLLVLLAFVAVLKRVLPRKSLAWLALVGERCGWTGAAAFLRARTGKTGGHGTCGTCSACAGESRALPASDGSQTIGTVESLKRSIRRRP